MKHLGRVFLAAMSVGLLLWACGDEEPATGPQEPSTVSVKIMAVPPDRSPAATEPFQLDALRDPKGLGLAQRSEATLRLIDNWPADTAWEKCQEQDGENCKEQGQTWTGQFYVHCLSEQCDPETFTWQLQNQPPGTSVSFSPTTTGMEERTTMSIEVDNDAETGVFDATVAAPPSPGTLNFKFHTLCSWGLGTCPKIEILNLMAAGYPAVNVSAAGEQSRLIGERMHLKVQHKAGTGEHTFEQEEQEWLVQWDGLGDLVYEYDITASQLQLYPFPEDMGEKDTIRYYHVIPNQYVVWATADLNYDDDEAEVGVLTKAVFNVNGPTNLSLTSQTDSIISGSVSGGGFGVQFGRLPPPGITWTFSATAPANDNGYVAGTQVMTGHVWIMDQNGQKHDEWYPNGDNFLDGCSLYDEPAQSSGSTYTWISRDTPGLYVGVADSAGSLDYDFDMYFMYRPAGFYSIWVPIGRLDWFFKTSVARQGSPGAWQVLSADGSLNSPSGGAHSAFPTWVGVYPSEDSCPNVPANLVHERPAAISRTTQLGQGVSP